MARVTIKVPAQSVPQPVPTPVAASAAPAAPTPEKKSKGKLVLIAAAAVFVGLLIVAVIVLFVQKNNLEDSAGSLAGAQSSQAEEYAAAISQYAELPTDVKPVLKPVDDAAKLSASNIFFKNAKDDDVVLLYVQPDKSVTAVLYRPSTKKIIELTSGASLNASDTDSSSSAVGQ